MQASLKVGLRYSHTFVIESSKTVPCLYPESPLFLSMPKIFATGYLVGLLEWACMELIQPYLDLSVEQSVGTHINVSHQAATPVGFTITVLAELVAIAGQKLSFKVEAHDGVDLISQGTHERFVVNCEKFKAKLAKKIRAFKLYIK